MGLALRAKRPETRARVRNSLLKALTTRQHRGRYTTAPRVGAGVGVRCVCLLNWRQSALMSSSEPQFPSL